MDVTGFLFRLPFRVGLNAGGMQHDFALAFRLPVLVVSPAGGGAAADDEPPPGPPPPPPPNGFPAHPFEGGDHAGGEEPPHFGGEGQEHAVPDVEQEEGGSGSEVLVDLVGPAKEEPPAPAGAAAAKGGEGEEEAADASALDGDGDGEPPLQRRRLA